MGRPKLKSVNLIQENIDKIGQLFPGVVTEYRDETGTLCKAVDFDLLRQELAADTVEGDKERYQLAWPGRKEAVLLANTPTDRTLRPVKEESADWESTQNLYIEGDNLEVLKLLRKSYQSKDKCIYIDPPYNTGRDFIYKDDFRQAKAAHLFESGQLDEKGNRLVQNNESNGRFHSDWLTMMFSRIKLAWHLLRKDGVIFISIDDHEIANLRKICDQIFGAENFGGTVIVQTNKGGQDYLHLAKTHEYLLCYFKGNEAGLNLLSKDDVSDFKYEDLNGNYELRELRNRNPRFNRQNRPNLFYPFFVNPNVKDDYGCCAVSLQRDSEHSVTVYPVNSAGKDSCWRWGAALASQNIVAGSPNRSRVVARQKKDGGWNIYEKNRKTLTKAKSIWDETGMRTERGTIALRELFKESYFDHPKPVELVEKVLQLGMNKDDIVLDFFSGSATTAHAVMRLNAADGGSRKYIMVQLPEAITENSEAFKAGFRTIAEIGKERIRRAARKLKEAPNADIDYGFRVFRVDSSNMKQAYYTPAELQQAELLSLVSNIKEDRTGDDLMVQIMLEVGLELSRPMGKREIEGYSVYFVGGQALIACFDQQVPEKVIRAIAAERPVHAVFRDSTFQSDADRVNVQGIFGLLSPDTEISVI